MKKAKKYCMIPNDVEGIILDVERPRCLRCIGELNGKQKEKKTISVSPTCAWCPNQPMICPSITAPVDLSSNAIVHLGLAAGMEHACVSIFSLFV